MAGYRAERVLDHVAGRCRVIVNDRFATTNSIVSLILAEPHVDRSPVPVERGGLDGQRLPFPDASFDSALVFLTPADRDRYTRLSPTTAAQVNV